MAFAMLWPQHAWLLPALHSPNSQLRRAMTTGLSLFDDRVVRQRHSASPYMRMISLKAEPPACQHAQHCACVQYSTMVCTVLEMLTGQYWLTTEEITHKHGDTESFCQSCSTPVSKLAQPCGLLLSPFDQKKNKAVAKLVTDVFTSVTGLPASQKLLICLFCYRAV